MASSAPLRSAASRSMLDFLAQRHDLITKFDIILVCVRDEPAVASQLPEQAWRMYAPGHIRCAETTEQR